jgi:hypothetical protein
VRKAVSKSGKYSSSLYSGMTGRRLRVFATTTKMFRNRAEASVPADTSEACRSLSFLTF